MNKVTEAEALDLTNELMDKLSDILKGYLLKMGLKVVPVIRVKPITSWTKTLSLKEIVDVVNNELGMHKMFPQGVKTVSRKREIVIRRQIICSLAMDRHYGCEQIAKALGIDHATVLHGRTKVSDQLHTKDKEMVYLYNKISYLLNAYYTEMYGESL